VFDNADSIPVPHGAQFFAVGWQPEGWQLGWIANHCITAGNSALTHHNLLVPNVGSDGRTISERAGREVINWRTAFVHFSQARNTAGISEAVRLNPAAYLPIKADILDNLSGSYADAGNFQRAVAAEQQAVEAYRKLAQISPAAYQQRLAASLNGLGLLYAQTNRFKEQEATFKEVIDIRSRLQPAIHPHTNPNLL